MNLSILNYLITLMLLMVVMVFSKSCYSIFVNSVLSANFDVSFNFTDQMMTYFSYVVVILSCFILIYSAYYMDHEVGLNRFMCLMLVFIISMVTLNFSDSCWTLWLGWEGLGVSSFLLIIYYSNWKSMNSSVVTLMLNRLGDFSLILGMSAFCTLFVWDLKDYKFSSWLAMLMILAIIAKSAQIPLQSWLPAAMAAPTPVSSLVHSSTLVVAGSILCLKLNNYFFSYSMYWLSLLGFLTSFYASVMAYLEEDFKKIMAYSTMSQIALVMFMLSVNLSKLMFMHIINHAFAKALLFMGVGAYILVMFGSQESRLLDLKIYCNKSVTFLMIVCLLVMCGVYYLSCFYSKEFILLFSFYQETLVAIINIMIFLSFAYSLRLVLFLMVSSELKLKLLAYTHTTNINLPVFAVMVFNGWFMMHNYSMPFNLYFVFEKNYLMLIPVVVIILCLVFYKKLSIFNLDLLYQFMFKLLYDCTSNINMKLKSMTLSSNFVFGLFTTYSMVVKMIILPFLIMSLLLMLSFVLPMN